MLVSASQNAPFSKESTTKKSAKPFLTTLKHVYAQKDSVEIFEVQDRLSAGNFSSAGNFLSDLFPDNLTQAKAGVPVRWYFNNTLIDSRSYSVLKYEATTENLTHRLIVKNITWRDCGVYTVRAYSTVQTAMLKLTEKFEETSSFK